MAVTPSQNLIAQGEFGRRVGVNRQTVQDLCARGILVRGPGGKLDWEPTLLAYCAHIRGVAAGRTSNGASDLDLTDERARKAKEEADKLEMENAHRRGQLLDRADVDAAVSGAFARVRARLLSVPTKVAPTLMPDRPTEAERIVRTAVVEVLRELADT
ncbi:MAG: hypothetical protein AAFR84_02915, partial [Pseudomonadota bacterium]